MTEFLTKNPPETPLEIFRPDARLVVHSEPYTDPETGEKGFYWCLSADTAEELSQNFLRIVCDADVTRRRVVNPATEHHGRWVGTFVTFHKLQTGEH